MKSNTPRSNLAKPIFILFLGCCLSLVGIQSAGAHRVNLFAWVEGETVYVEGKFSGSKRASKGKIIVMDSMGAQLLTGTTNADGEFHFKIPQKTELKIVLEAGTGHRAEWTIPADEIEMAASAEKTEPQKKTTLINIIIGVGCIFGLTAMAAYISRRKKNKRIQ